jgi:hypothetical protein
MTKPTIVSGKFARVFAGNGNWDWLPEGDDLQARANANINPYWMTPGRDCPLGERNVDGHALAYDLGTKTVYVLYTSREAADRAAQREA